jgi:type IV secretory pathway VirD2 relaxase
MPKNSGKLPWGTTSAGRADPPALTLSDSPVFRVRLGTTRAARTPKLKAFSGRIKALVRKHSAGAGGRHQPLGKHGRGGGAAARIAVRAAPQRVTVKSRVVRHSRYRATGGTSSALAKHVDYLGRGGVAEEGGRGVIFDANRELSREDLKTFREGIVSDRHHFRFIVSPEAGNELNLRTYARDFVTAMEADLGTQLQWLGVAHYDTDNPHLHLLVRGKFELGADLVINRDYMSHGMRLQAGEVATRALGPRRAEDIERSLERDLTAERVTGLDIGLAHQAGLHPDGIVSALRKGDGSLAGERQRLNTLTRLQHLESLGLAREIRPGIWQPDRDLVERLKQLSISGDVIKLMHERMRGADPGITTVIFNKDHPPKEPVVGRVYARGTADELTDAEYLLIEARDGRAYYVSLGEFSELKGREAGVGAIVRVAPSAPAATGAADRNITRMAATNGGIYDAELHAAAAEQGARLPSGVSAQDYVNSHRKRAQALARRGLVEDLGQDRFRIPTDLQLKLEAATAAGRDRGIVTQVERLSTRDIDAQMTEDGVTWLDQELKDGVSIGAPRVGASRFERQLGQALQGRAKHLASSGLGEIEDGQFRARGRFLDELYERELQAADRGLKARFGAREPVAAGASLEGRIASIEDLPSGPHAVLDMAGRYALIPATPALAKQVGQELKLNLSRGRQFHPMGEGAMKLGVRFEAIDLSRTRKRGR